MQTEIIYMQENGITRDMLLALPSRIPHIAPSVIRHMNTHGVIARAKKGRDNITVWRGGCHYTEILRAWK